MNAKIEKFAVVESHAYVALSEVLDRLQTLKGECEQHAEKSDRFRRHYGAQEGKWAMMQENEFQGRHTAYAAAAGLVGQLIDGLLEREDKEAA